APEAVAGSARHSERLVAGQGGRRARRVLSETILAVVRGGGSGPQWHAAQQHRAGDSRDHPGGGAGGRGESARAAGLRAAPGVVGAASARDRQFGLALAAHSGRADALKRVIDLGVELNSPSPDLFSHATALHHAVASGSLEAVKVLVEAGADLSTCDTVWNGT